MSDLDLQAAAEKKTVEELVATNVKLRPAQREMLLTLFRRWQAYENQVVPKLKELGDAFNEVLFFVKKDLNVPTDENWRLSEDLSELTKNVTVVQEESTAPTEAQTDANS